VACKLKTNKQLEGVEFAGTTADYELTFSDSRGYL